MGGAVNSGQDNDELVDNLMVSGYVRTKKVEQVFRAVDRADYVLSSCREGAYNKDRAWKHGNIHLSAPCIYSKVLEGLSLEPGLSFLNLGSGTGYLSTMAGLILQQHGTNHGIELHEDCLKYAYERLEKFKQKSLALNGFDFCEPIFVQGNCLSVIPGRQYDRVYCGAACPESHKVFIKQFVRIGGILVMPYRDQLLRLQRMDEDIWTQYSMLRVSFATLVIPPASEHNLFHLPECNLPLQKLCRGRIRHYLRQNINDELVDNLMESGYIRTKKVEQVFRAVDRADYVLSSCREGAYNKDRAWKHGNIHLSAPCIYSKVLEGLSLEPGLSFLNLGSGTGYLSTMAGLILQQHGTNHGIELHEDCLKYAYERLEEFKQKSLALNEFDFCEPIFVQGNCLSVIPGRQYDRVYCGAACPESHEVFIKQFVRIGGILVMPYRDQLLRVQRMDKDIWTHYSMLRVSFATLVIPPASEHNLFHLPECNLPLQKLCRGRIRHHLRQNINDELVDNLMESGYIRTKKVEQVFRAVDRDDYVLSSCREGAYNKNRAWKHGNIHLSAPCIYSKVLEGLSLEPGFSFLNLGSGTGYLSTMAGLILQQHGTNHGIELHEDCLKYAYERLEEFKQKSLALNEFDFCEPIFVQGNCLSVIPGRQYDRVYCGAACPESHKVFIKQFVRIGGILVMPYRDQLLRLQRMDEDIWTQYSMLRVSFATLVIPPASEHNLFHLPECNPLPLQELCRGRIRHYLRQNINDELVDNLMVSGYIRTKKVEGSTKGSTSRKNATIVHFVDSNAFAVYMREKIQQLPLPFSIKLYMNYNRKL